MKEYFQMGFLKGLESSIKCFHLKQEFELLFKLNNKLHTSKVKIKMRETIEEKKRKGLKYWESWIDISLKYKHRGKN